MNREEYQRLFPGNLQSDKGDIRMIVRAEVANWHADHCGCGGSRDCSDYEHDVRVTTAVVLKLRTLVDPPQQKEA